VDFKYISKCTCQDLCALTKSEVTYLNLADKTFGGPLHPVCLLDLGDLFMAGPVVSTLAPNIDMLASIVGAPLDLFHLIVRVCLHHWPLTKDRSTLRCSSLDMRLPYPSRGWSSVPLFCPTTRWGIGCSALIPRRGVCVDPFSGWVLGSSLPHGGLPHGG
jgi:hypothetical protein